MPSSRTREATCSGRWPGVESAHELQLPYAHGVAVAHPQLVRVGGPLPILVDLPLRIDHRGFAVVGNQIRRAAKVRMKDLTEIHGCRPAFYIKTISLVEYTHRPAEHLGPSLAMRDLFSFPNPVNDKAARVVAGGVLVAVLVTVATSWYWLLVPLAYGFWARVLTGPTLSPLGWTAQNLVAPRLGLKRPVPGPPKRFAQGIGAVMSTAALVLAFAVSPHGADAVLIVLMVAAGLESIFGYCTGYKIFGLLMRAGLVSETVCEDCADISRRLHTTVG